MVKRNTICFCAIESVIPRHKKSPEKISSQGIPNYTSYYGKYILSYSATTEDSAVAIVALVVRSTSLTVDV